MRRTKDGRGSLKCLITADVCRPPLEEIVGGGTLFTEGGHYYEFCPRGTLFSELCPGGQYSPVNNVQGDILWGDSLHYDTGIVKQLQRYTVYPYVSIT